MKQPEDFESYAAERHRRRIEADRHWELTRIMFEEFLAQEKELKERDP